MPQHPHVGPTSFVLRSDQHRRTFLAGMALEAHILEMDARHGLLVLLYREADSILDTLIAVEAPRTCSLIRPKANCPSYLLEPRCAAVKKNRKASPRHSGLCFRGSSSSPPPPSKVDPRQSCLLHVSPPFVPLLRC